MSNAEKMLTDHSYDGIQEYDNPLPGWWKWLFVGSIVFSFFYLMYFHMGADGRSVLEEYDTAVAANLRQQFQEIGELKPDHDTIVKYSHDPKWLVVGQSVFKSNCVSCHGTEGQGLVGPNLTDNFYKNVSKIEDISKVVAEGAAGQAMPAWKNRLHPNELVLVSSYVAAIRGKNLPGPKGQEGKEIPAWDESVTENEKPAPTTPAGKG
ncbi:c-type cytochrome [bacterium]|nr:c-type cytochrome [bacterium]